MSPLKEVRLRKFMTIRELAAAAEVTPKTIVDIEARRSSPRPTTMRRIAAALDIDPSEVSEFAATVEAAIAKGTSQGQGLH